MPCPICDSALVQPLRWAEGSVRMRCPECHSCFAAAVSAPGLRRLEAAHRAGRAALVAAHEQLVGERADALAAAFAAALDDGHLGADDCASRP